MNNEDFVSFVDTPTRLEPWSNMANKPSLEELLRSVPEETLEKPCSDEHIVKIASEITNWQSIAPHLGLKPVDEETILQNHRDVQLQRREMLRTWQQKFGSNATYDGLAKALYDAERVDLVGKVVDVLTEEATAADDPESGPPPCKKAALGSGALPVPLTPRRATSPGKPAVCRFEPLTL